MSFFGAFVPLGIVNDKLNTLATLFESVNLSLLNEKCSCEKVIYLCPVRIQQLQSFRQHDCSLAFSVASLIP